MKQLFLLLGSGILFVMYLLGLYLSFQLGSRITAKLASKLIDRAYDNGWDDGTGNAELKHSVQQGSSI